MGHAMYMYVLELLIVVCSLRGISSVVTIHSPGGHVGDEFNVHCTIRNHDGRAAFFRYKDGEREFIPGTGDTAKYEVYRCDKTEGGVSGENSVLTMFEATVSDSGTYGCVPGVNGEYDWEASKLTNITVRSACYGADGTNPSSLTTDTKQEPDKEKQLQTDGVVQPCSQSSVAHAVPVRVVLFGLTFVALCAV